ncbi:serine/threonine-protein kinase [Streptomyces sp. XD-27]|uniref:serine/threonine-protein kinase n=1 Tax=Streptomyces sp. XD-27 TaxID=3062779 RepID=UPI0026F43FC8|nr:serine/threonine-protein kinase [Streptomyces sp. XD-27]WKX70669.1 serine/threonine-protein kinase [Streptomyces sp. XD-27]
MPHAHQPVLKPLGPDDPREVSGYQLLAKIGEGGMGSVYLTRTRGDQPVALKLIRRGFAQNPDFRARFEAEVQAARRVSGYHIVPVLDHNMNGDQPWIATSYVAGLALDDAMAAFGPLPLPAALQVVGCTARALVSVHAVSVIHRDLKPSNILLSSQGPWVIDFGIARATDTTQLTRTGGFIGTPQYMSPEHALGRKVTPATDVFALGLIAAVVATGRHPYGDGSGLSVAAQIANTQVQPPDLSGYPDQLRPLLEVCLAADPAARPTPAALADWCQQVSGRQLSDFTGWLPPQLAGEIARREQAALQPPQPQPTPQPQPQAAPPTAPPTAPVPPATYVPTQAAPPGPVAPAYQAYAPTQAAAPAPQPPAVPVPVPARRNRKPLLIGGGVVALAVAGAVIMSSGGDDKPRNSDPSTYTASDVKDETVYMWAIPDEGSSVNMETFYDLDADFGFERSNDRDVVKVGTEEMNIDGHRIIFRTKFGKAKSDSVKDCAAAARGQQTLPDVLEKEQLTGANPLIRQGDVLCTVTTDKNLAMLKITKVLPGEQRNPAADIPMFDAEWTRFEP